jgi:hypothetical protein
MVSRSGADVTPLAGNPAAAVWPSVRIARAEAVICGAISRI